MVNEIKGAPVNLVQTSTNSPTNRLQGDAGKQGSGGAAADSSDVTLTATAEKLRNLEAEIQSQPVVDTQRVESVKKAIFDGTFNFDSGRTAEKMAEFESLLTSKGSPE